jgi:hypothetical protein
LKSRQRCNVEDLPATLYRHGITQGMAQAGEGENVQLDQVLFLAPVLGKKVPIATHRSTVHQQVDLALAFLELQQKAGQPQGFSQVTGTE